MRKMLSLIESVVLLFILDACSTEESLFYTTSVNPVSNNEAGNILIALLREQTQVWNFTKELCGKKELLFDATKFSYSSDYGWHYNVPCSSHHGIIDGCLVYKLRYSAASESKDVSFNHELDNPLLLDIESLKKGMRDPYLLSATFKNWKKQGLKVKTDLTNYADSVDIEEQRKRVQTHIGEYNQCIGDWIRVSVEYEIVPRVISVGSGYEIISISKETMKKEVEFAADCVFYNANQIDIAFSYERIPFMLFLDIRKNDYFYLDETNYDISCMLEILANALLSKGILDFTYSYRFNGIFEKLPNPNDLESGSSTGGGTGGGVTGGGSGGGSGSNDEDLEGYAAYATRFDHYFDDYLSIKLKELGIDRSYAMMIATDTINSYGRYYDKTGILMINEKKMQDEGFTEDDMRACIYHEYVHVKQDVVNNIEIERDAEGLFLLKPYTVYRIQEDVDAAYEDFNDTLIFSEIPTEGGTEWQQRERERYYRMLVEPVLTEFQQQTPAIGYYNKDVVRGEVEAYMLQEVSYGSRMSSFYRFNIARNYKRYSNIWKWIKNQ